MAEKCPICHMEPETHKKEEFWVIGCKNDSCPFAWRNSKYRYPNIQPAEEDWNNKIEAYKEGKFGYYSF